MCYAHLSFNRVIYYGLLFPGSTAAHSKQNLIQWLDALVYGLSAASLVYDLDGNREHTASRAPTLIKSLQPCPA